MDGKLILKLRILLGCGLDMLLVVLSLALPRWVQMDYNMVYGYRGLWHMCIDYTFLAGGIDCISDDFSICKQTSTLRYVNTYKPVHLKRVRNNSVQYNVQ